ncbi:PSP1-domain-containing protein [Hesseltinella vesiculosa]|uniref:PSP1-domain-containing protein n=1 Tax=Hesseltinella vesiculosa TaxID=101127 RepID=A0A1X2GNN4_9FUNG|nr:PSP1-domain-containing protein [Hesseltinella vesiculosa]
MSQSSAPRKEKQADKVIPVSIPTKPASAGGDNSWKVVGSPSRRGSLATSMTQAAAMSSNSPVTSPTPNAMEIPGTNSGRRASVDTQWGSFGGLQWEGPGIFDEAKNGGPIPPVFADDIPPYQPTAATLQHLPSFACDSNSILSVPMLPSVSMEPIYRQQRSMSFSVGQQDPTMFGFDDDEDLQMNRVPYGFQQQQQQFYKSSLATMQEEQPEDDQRWNGLLMEEDISAARWRVRSQSSGAAFSLLSPTQQAALLGNPATILRRGSTDAKEDLLAQRRRSSRLFDNVMSKGDKERLESIQRRLSQTQLPNDYQFPPDPAFMAQQRRSSLTQPPMQYLTDQLEATHLSANSSYGYNPRYPAVMPREEYFDAEHQQQQLQSMTTGAFRDMGKGIPLPRLPGHAPIYAVEFKAGRTDYFYVVSEPGVRAAPRFQPNDLVIVEGDRGKDLGKVTSEVLTVDNVEQLLQQFPPPTQQQVGGDDDQGSGKKDAHIKRLYRLAAPEEINLLIEKDRDELHALTLCQQKTQQRNLPMTVVDAEYQWDRRKLTFFFVADRRIDFRDLVRELFKIYKTRIWMCAVPTNAYHHKPMPEFVPSHPSVDPDLEQPLHAS